MGAIRDGPWRPQREPTLAHVLDDIRGPDAVEIRVVLAGERGRRGVLERPG
jgi:hypothetical protein